jgi:hypothetical protein
MDPIDAMAVLRWVPELFQITKALEALAPGRHFNADGHLVGSIGEAVAAARYGLELTTASTKGVDAHHKASGHEVEIKATVEGKRIALRGMEPKQWPAGCEYEPVDGAAVEAVGGSAVGGGELTELVTRPSTLLMHQNDAVWPFSSTC